MMGVARPHLGQWFWAAMYPYWNYSIKTLQIKHLYSGNLFSSHSNTLLRYLTTELTTSDKGNFTIKGHFRGASGVCYATFTSFRHEEPSFTIHCTRHPKQAVRQSRTIPQQEDTFQHARRDKKANSAWHWPRMTDSNHRQERWQYTQIRRMALTGVKWWNGSASWECTHFQAQDKRLWSGGWTLEDRPLEAICTHTHTHAHTRGYQGT